MTSLTGGGGCTVGGVPSFKGYRRLCAGFDGFWSGSCEWTVDELYLTRETMATGHNDKKSIMQLKQTYPIVTTALFLNDRESHEKDLEQHITQQ